MLAQFYYDLKDSNSLPPGSRFLDPYDHTPYLPNQGESLEQFIKRVEDDRTQKYSAGCPAIVSEELKQLVVDSLFATTANKHTEKYFERKPVPITQDQVFSFIKATALNLISGVQTSPKKRKDRALHCLSGCQFHRTSRQWNKAITKIISKVVGIKEALISEEEKALGVCTMCGGCALQPKVTYPLQSVLASITPDQLDDMLRKYGNSAFEVCWIFKESLSDPAAHQLLFSKISAVSNNSARGVAALQFMQRQSPRQNLGRRA